MCSKSIDSLIKDIDDEIDRLSETDTRALGQEDDKILRLKLFKFFRIAFHEKWIPKLAARGAAAPILEQIVEQVQQTSEGTSFKVASFRGFEYPSVQKVGLALHYCRPLKDAVPKTEWFLRGGNERLREVWRDIVGPEPEWQPHFLKRLTRPDGEVATADNCVLQGDYLLFRADGVGTAMPAFFRFYAHEVGERIRSMGLRLDKGHGPLSSKGWVIRQEHGFMVAGYIIERRTDGDVLIDGGFSLMSVSAHRGSDLVQINDGRIAMAPVLHMQMPYSDHASCSRGLLVRLRNAEHLGGQRKQQKRTTRHTATMRFHEQLRDKFGKKLELRVVAQILAEASGLPETFFLQTRQTTDDDIPHSEIFDNTPTSDKNPTGAKMAPLTIPTVPQRLEDPPKREIYIDFNAPPRQFKNATRRS